MRVLFVASELTPIAKVGGLGDVAGALPKALAKLGVDVRVALPYYDVIDEKKYPIWSLGCAFPVVTPKGEGDIVRIFTTVIPGSSVPVYLFHNKQYLSEGGIYFERSAFVGSFREIERFLFFSMAVAHFPLHLWTATDETHDAQWWPDIIHCQDWHTAAIPLYIKVPRQWTEPIDIPGTPEKGINTIRTLFTIHNLANQGRWKAEEILNALTLTPDAISSLARRRNGDISLMEQGILNCDMLNTVSPTYAKEILTPEFGEGIEDALREREKDLVGIVNGIDVDRFNPETDPDIAACYTVATLEKKKEDKAALLREVGLPVSDAPLFGLVSRLTNQKGIDLIAAVLDRLVAAGGAGVFLGMADPVLEKAITDAVTRYPKNLFFKIGFDAVLAQKIYAGSDIFLMPSRFEPCGLGQMIAMRYGTIPIVRATGGLKDTVRDGETGFVFTEYSADALWQTIERALTMYRDPKHWRAMQKNAMSQDFSWDKSARAYMRLYEQLVSLDPKSKI